MGVVVEDLGHKIQVIEETQFIIWSSNRQKVALDFFCFVDWAGFSKTLRSVQITFEQKQKSMTANLKHLSLLTWTEDALKQSHVRQLFQRLKKKLRPPIGFLLQKFTFSRSQ